MSRLAKVLLLVFMCFSLLIRSPELLRCEDLIDLSNEMSILAKALAILWGGTVHT